MVNRKFCDGWARRDFLRVGAVGAMGLNLSLERLLAAEAKGDIDKSKNDINFIFVFLKGGLSTIDTFDLKPNAPSEIRGPFKSIRSNVPGTHVGEHIPETAKVMDKFSLIRSFGHRNAGHGPADHFMFTGYHPLGGFNGGLKPNNQQPSMGSVIATKLGARGPVPPTWTLDPDTQLFCVDDDHLDAGAFASAWTFVRVYGGPEVAEERQHELVEAQIAKYKARAADSGVELREAVVLDGVLAEDMAFPCPADSNMWPVVKHGYF